MDWNGNNVSYNPANKYKQNISSKIVDNIFGFKNNLLLKTKNENYESEIINFSDLVQDILNLKNFNVAKEFIMTFMREDKNSNI